MEDEFKLADEVRAENHGEGWDPVAEVAIPADPVETPAEVPVDTPTEVPEEPKVEETETETVKE